MRARWPAGGWCCRHCVDVVVVIGIVVDVVFGWRVVDFGCGLGGRLSGFRVGPAAGHLVHTHLRVCVCVCVCVAV